MIFLDKWVTARIAFEDGYIHEVDLDKMILGERWVKKQNTHLNRE
jgi:hypothetical protein